MDPIPLFKDRALDAGYLMTVNILRS
jgi:hypothetical protein